MDIEGFDGGFGIHWSGMVRDGEGKGDIWKSFLAKPASKRDLVTTLGIPSPEESLSNTPP